MNKEKELAKGIYLMLHKDMASSPAYRVAVLAENIGRLMLVAKRHDIFKMLTILTGEYLDDYKKNGGG